MIRAPVSNAVIVSVLFSVLAGGGMLLVTERPAFTRAIAAAGNCLPASGVFRASIFSRNIK
ncbi:MAG: hypothetical protein CTY15_05530 [Methylocystis sp.]|nr:MAG: hypothetical protein CTY15_05530 [Methylocystis sp.]